jgi:hypothetical protein
MRSSQGRGTGRLRAVSAPGLGTNGASRTASLPACWRLCAVDPEGRPHLIAGVHTAYDLEALVRDKRPLPGWRLVALLGWDSLHEAA